MTTPVRALAEPDSAGVSRLSDPGHDYADGSEQELLAIVSSASDRSSLSEELRGHIHDWATEYHLSPVRGNLVRGLSLNSAMTALEIGAGCGAVGRTLAEWCGATDLLEPMHARAAVAAARVADLPNARVFQGVLGDLPAEPSYDVILCVGVLEYVGNGTDDESAYVTFLGQCARLLRPGGTLIVAIENALGAKYIAGRSEDHTNRPFDSLEQYLLPNPARTFSRARLTRLAQAAGLTPEIYAALPDYKLPSAIVSPTAFQVAPQLAADIHRTPSRDYTASGVEGADERRLWAQLVDAGVGPDFPNSFLMLATAGAPSALWDPQLLAAHFTTERRRAFATATTFRDENGVVSATRRLIDTSSRESVKVERLTWRTTDDRVHTGRMLSDHILDAAEPEPLLKRWADVVRHDDASQMDLQPWNIIVTKDGWKLIDQEWTLSGIDHDDVVRRGVLLLAFDLGSTRRFESPAGDATPREVMRAWGKAAGVSMEDHDISSAIALEAQIAEMVRPLAASELEQVLLARLDMPLREQRPPRVDVRLRAAEAKRDEYAALFAHRTVRSAVTGVRLREAHAPLRSRVAAKLRYTRLGDRMTRTPAVRGWLDRRRET